MENENLVFKPSALPEVPELDTADGPQPAGFSERFLAYVIDAMPFLLGNQFSGALFGASGVKTQLAWIGAYIVYEAVLSSGGRATLGKYILDLRVVAKDGSHLSFAKALVRAVSYFVSSATFNAGYVLALATPENRALHDYLAGSKVVRIKERSDLADGMVIAVSWGLMAFLGGAWVNTNVIKLSPKEKKQIMAAHKTITKLGKLEEFYYREKGHYTNDLKPLAAMTGNVKAVRAELIANLEPRSLIIISNGREYTIYAKALNWRKTQVEVHSKPAARGPQPMPEQP